MGSCRSYKQASSQNHEHREGDGEKATEDTSSGLGGNTGVDGGDSLVSAAGRRGAVGSGRTRLLSGSRGGGAQGQSGGRATRAESSDSSANNDIGRGSSHGGGTSRNGTGDGDGATIGTAALAEGDGGGVTLRH